MWVRVPVVQERVARKGPALGEEDWEELQALRESLWRNRSRSRGFQGFGLLWEYLDFGLGVVPGMAWLRWCLL